MFARLSKHLQSIDYVDLNLADNVVRDMKFLPLGQILRDNISRERGTDQIVREECFDYQSFPQDYLAKSKHLKRRNPLEVLNVANLQSTSEESPGISLKTCKVLCSPSLVAPKHAFELFHQTQRQRKIWWMKFVYNPGQVVLTSPTRTETSQTISISLKSAEGFAIELERIGLFSLEKTNALLSWFSLDTSVLSFLIDGLPEVESGLFTLNLHRRLSPFKVALLADSKVNEDVRDLGKLINLQLGEKNLNVLNRIDSRETLEKNFSHADQIGIPYSLILGRESLETGLLKLRNRNTTLSEVIHISDVPDYVEKVIQG